MWGVEDDPAQTPDGPINAAPEERHTLPKGSSGCRHGARGESSPEQIACDRDDVDGSEPPQETFGRNGVPQGQTQKCGNDCVDGDGGGDVPVLDAHQLGSDQTRSPWVPRQIARTARGMLSVRFHHTLILSV